MKILLIEDDADTAAYVADGLREHGHVVDRVADGGQGLSRAADERYELLIVDRMLPGVDGLAIVKTVCAGGVRPVLFSARSAAPDDRVTGLDAGGDDYP
jgi:two-component system OmpR family response regulator